MSGQFDLGTKHSQLKEVIKTAVSKIESTNAKVVVKELFAKGIGQYPSSKTKYDDFLGLTVTFEEVAKTKPEAASLMVDQIIAEKICDSSYDENTIYAVLVAEPANALLDTLQAKAVATANGFKIEATKQVTPEQLLADKFIIVAKAEDENLYAFLIDKSDISTSPVENKFVGGEVVLNQIKVKAEVSASAKIRQICEKFEQIQAMSRTLIAAISSGISEAALTSAVTVAKSARGENGAVSSTQSAQFTFADLFASLEAGKLLTYQSADMIDSGNLSLSTATMAKIRATDAATEVILKSLQMMGNLGCIANNNYASALSVALNNQIKGGTNRVQKNQLYKYMLAKK